MVSTYANEEKDQLMSKMEKSELNINRNQCARVIIFISDTVIHTRAKLVATCLVPL